MGQRITFDPAAQRDLRAIDRETAKRILDALARLVFLDEGDVKRLQGYDPPESRLRVGEYRLRFRRTGDLYYVVAIKHRSEAYR